MRMTPVEALTLGLDLVYTLSKAGLDPLALAAPEWSATHPAQSYDFSRTHTYSDQDLAQLEVGLDARYRINQAFWVDARYRHAKLDDDDPYIVDIGGELNSVTLAVGHQF